MKIKKEAYDALSDAQKALFEQDGDEYVLKAVEPPKDDEPPKQPEPPKDDEGEVERLKKELEAEKKRVKEFRDNNIAATKTNKEVTEANKAMEARLAEIEKREKAAREKNQANVMREQIRSIASGARVRSSATPDIEWRVNQAGFRVNDNDEVFRADSEGNPVANDKGLAHFIGGLEKDNPHLFEKASGIADPRLGPKDRVQTKATLSNPSAADLSANLAAIASGETVLTSA